MREDSGSFSYLLVLSCTQYCHALLVSLPFFLSLFFALFYFVLCLKQPSVPCTSRLADSTSQYTFSPRTSVASQPTARSQPRAQKVAQARVSCKGSPGIRHTQAASASRITATKSGTGLRFGVPVTRVGKSEVRHAAQQWKRWQCIFQRQQQRRITTMAQPQHRLCNAVATISLS